MVTSENSNKVLKTTCEQFHKSLNFPGLIVFLEQNYNNCIFFYKIYDHMTNIDFYTSLKPFFHKQGEELNHFASEHYLKNYNFWGKFIHSEINASP